MGLRIWNLLLDPYDHEQLADNWAKVDAHDHSQGRGVLIPTEGIALEAISYPLIASSVFPEITAVGGEVEITAEEEKGLTGGPEITVPATGMYELRLRLTGEITTNAFAHLKAYVSKNATKTEFTMFDWASATEKSRIVTTNFTRVELKESDVLKVWCGKTGTGHAIFSKAHISIWRVP